MSVFGTMPRRGIEPYEEEMDMDPLVASLLDRDDEFEKMIERRAVGERGFNTEQ